MSVTLSRRGFLAGIIAACAAPAIIRSGVLMPVKPRILSFEDIARLQYEALVQSMYETQERMMARVLNESLVRWDRVMKDEFFAAAPEYAEISGVQTT